MEEYMHAYRLTHVYSKAFAAFLACTDEKLVLLQEIGRDLKHRRVQTVLDIGAGNGDLAIPLSTQVDRYVAIEPKGDYATRLREHDIAVIEQAFPCELGTTFDAVLSSHSLPWKSAVYIPFLSAAWAHVAEKGVLLVITYDDSSKSESASDRPGFEKPADHAVKKHSFWGWRRVGLSDYVFDKVRWCFHLR